MKNAGALSRLTWLVVAVAWAAAGGSVELPLSVSGPIVSLGYATYEGYYNGTYDLNIWKRYGRFPFTLDMAWLLACAPARLSHPTASTPQR